MKSALPIIAALSAFIGVAHADSPLSPPSPHRAVSPNGQFVVISDPTNGTRVVESGSGKQLCEFPGWSRSIYIADDGEHLAIGYAGLNLVPLSADDSLELITFWTHCRKTKSVPLRSIAPDRSILQRTVSHYAWGNITGIDQGNHLVVTRIDGRVFRFNMVNGEAE